MSKRHSGYTQLFAIVRVNVPLSLGKAVGCQEMQNSITVTKVVFDLEVALKEVDRLTELNKDKGVVYFWSPTRAHFRLETDCKAEAEAPANNSGSSRESKD